MDEETTPKTNSLNLYVKSITSFVVLAAIAGGAYYYLNQSDSSMTPSDEAVEATGPVAKVNGVEVSRFDYENRFEAISNNSAQQGFDPADATVASQIKEEALNVLINTKLLIQAAEENEIEVTDEEVEEEYQKIVVNLGGEEGLAEAMKNMNLSEEKLRKDIREQLAITELIQIKTNYSEITVSDAEVAEYYQNVSASNADIPELETVSEQIKAQILSEKQQDVIGNLIETLRIGANIEILI